MNVSRALLWFEQHHCSEDNSYMWEWLSEGVSLRVVKIWVSRNALTLRDCPLILNNTVCCIVVINTGWVCCLDLWHDLSPFNKITVLMTRHRCWSWPNGSFLSRCSGWVWSMYVWCDEEQRKCKSFSEKQAVQMVWCHANSLKTLASLLCTRSVMHRPFLFYFNGVDSSAFSLKAKECWHKSQPFTFRHTSD